MPLTVPEAGALHEAVLALLNAVNAGPTPYRRAAREYERVLHSVSVDPPPPTGLMVVVPPAQAAGLEPLPGSGQGGGNTGGRYRPRSYGETPPDRSRP